MTQTVYPFDPHGTNGACYIKNEANSLLSSFGTRRCVIPKAAPFYKKDFVAVSGGRTLVEGVDFYFGHQYVRGTHQTAQAIYGSIYILNSAVTTPLTLTYRTLGGQYTTTDVKITTYLANSLTDPTTARWEDVITDLYFPPVDIDYNIDTYRDEKDLANALASVGTAIVAQDPKADDRINLYESWLDEETNIVTESQWEQHLHNRDETVTIETHGTNPHKTMWYQAGALKSDGIAQNTEKLTNLTIDQLTTQARDTQGIQISKYFPLDAERVLTGDLILADGRAGISRKAIDGSKEALIQLSTGNSHVNGDRNVTVIADQKRERVGTSASLKSGANVLKVVSSGPDQEPDQLFFNDQLVLTTETLKDHLPLDVNASVNVVTENTAEMTFSGKGSTLDPLKVTFNYPTGTTALRGLVRLTSALDNSQPAYAGTPAAVKTLNDRLANLIPNTRKVNGMALTGPIVITKSQLSIQYVENLADMDYPVYPQYQVELDKYSVTNHSHNIDDFDINAATSSVAGVVKYAYNIGSDTTTALNSYVYQLLSNRLGGLEASVNTKVPANALKLNKYGAATYLPVPAVAMYSAAGPNTISQTIVGEVELDGTLVILRNGSDIIDSGVYYAYMSLDADGAITKYTATPMQYAPSFLPAGVTARAVYRGSEGVFILRDSTDAYWVVLTNNTMESKYHIGSKLLGSMPYGQQLMPIIVDDSVYFIYTNLSTIEYAFKAWKVPKASIGSGTLTVTAQTFTGTDVYGKAQTNVTTYTLVPGGVSTDPTAKVLAIDTSGGKWRTRNVRQSQLNYDVVAEGTSVRVMIYVTSYFANTATSMWKYFTTSFVIDFAAKSAAVDLPAGFPLVYSATDLTTALPKGGTDKGFPFAQANNYAGVIRSAGKRFAYFYKDIAVIPAISAFKYTYSGTDIQQIKDVNVSSAALGATYSILGNYVSPVHMNCRGYHLIKGNRYIAVNGDGTYVMGEYSPTTRYIAGDAGYGPTANRTSITQAKFESLKRTLFNASTGQSDGVVLMDDLLTVNSKYDPSTDVQSAPVSISTAEFNALKALFFARVPTADAGTRFIKSKLSVYVPNDATLPVLGVYVYRAYTDDTSTTTTGKMIVAQLSVGSRTTLSGVALVYVPYTYTFSSTGTVEIGDYNPAIGGSCVGKLADGTVVYTLQTNFGGDEAPGFMMVYTPSNSTWVKIESYSVMSQYASGRYITSDRGLFALYTHSSGEGAVMSLLGTTLTEVTNGATLGSGIFNSSRVAEGWYVYLTEPMSYVANGIRYTLPTQTMDLRTYFPGAYQNRTLYLFADIQGGTAKYVWSSVKNPDSTTATYIGYCKTGTDRITELALECVTRLGDFKELVDHKNSIVAHGVSNNTQSTIGLPLVENRAPAYELDTSVFSEVFNSWLRISHAPADYTQPANVTEAAAWAYSAATDTISCTMNTATYVGFVSPNKIADYEFDTVVGVPATSADGDSDAISIIIGYVEVNGVQRTLSVVRSRSIEAHLKVTTQFGIYYDYQLPDQLTVATVDTTASETVGSWRGYYSRIHVKRVGNTFTVKATKLDTKTYSSVTDADYIFNMTFTLDDLPELAIFKGPIQYGYGAFSQTDAAYINYLRPDADGRNYYGTTIEAMKALYWQRNAVIQSGIIAHGGVLPIPAGLTRDQCRYYLTIDKLLNGTASSAIQDINLTYDPTTYVVTASFTRADGSTIAGNAAYTVLAAPGFKLFN